MRNTSNSKKRVMNIICAALQGIALLLFVFCPYAKYTIAPNFTITNPDIMFLATDNGTLSFMDFFSCGGVKIYGILGVAFLLLGIVMCVISAIQNDGERDRFSHVLVPVISFVVVASGIFLLIESVSAVVSTAALNGFAWKSIFGLIGLSIAMNLVKRSKLIVPAKTAEPAVVIQKPTSNADELKKYKELLDSGVITQEEFDAKKKQLLGL